MESDVDDDDDARYHTLCYQIQKKTGTRESKRGGCEHQNKPIECTLKPSIRRPPSRTNEKLRYSWVSACPKASIRIMNSNLDTHCREENGGHIKLFTAQGSNRVQEWNESIETNGTISAQNPTSECLKARTNNFFRPSLKRELSGMTSR